MKRRVADGAALVRRRVFYFQRVADLFRARGCERGGGALRMKIFQRPDEELILFFSAAAVTTGIGTGSRAKESRRRVRAARRRKAENQSRDEMATNCFTHGSKLVNGVNA